MLQVCTGIYDGGRHYVTNCDHFLLCLKANRKTWLAGPSWPFLLFWLFSDPFLILFVLLSLFINGITIFIFLILKQKWGHRGLLHCDLISVSKETNLFSYVSSRLRVLVILFIVPKFLSSAFSPVCKCTDNFTPTSPVPAVTVNLTLPAVSLWQQINNQWTCVYRSLHWR